MALFFLPWIVSFIVIAVQKCCTELNSMYARQQHRARLRQTALKKAAKQNMLDYGAAVPLTVKTLSGDVYEVIDWVRTSDLHEALATAAPELAPRKKSFKLSFHPAGDDRSIVVGPKAGSDGREALLMAMILPKFRLCYDWSMPHLSGGAFLYTFRQPELLLTYTDGEAVVLDVSHV